MKKTEVKSVQAATLCTVCGLFLLLPATSSALPFAVTPTDRDEEAMFGGGSSADDGSDGEVGACGAAGAARKPGAAGKNGEAGGREDFGDPRMSERAREKTGLLDADRLQIGGLMYARSGAFFAEDVKLHSSPLSMSTLTDIYFDARPNDRVRTFVRGRMLWSPVTSSATGGAFFGVTGGAEPITLQLDQLWIKTDIGRVVYVTVGAQPVRWGTTRLWNPVDIIYSERRSPVTLFDQRVGIPMVKLHMPFEVRLFDHLEAWNAYVLALLDRATDLEHVGAAGRLEAVAGTAELGLSAVKRKGSDPRMGVDLNAGVWDFDVKGELSVRLDAAGESHWMVSGGLEYGLEVGDDDTVYLGLEYFHNPEGAATAHDAMYGVMQQLIPSLMAGQGTGGTPALHFTPFYIGRHYAALSVTAMGPGSWDDTTLIANLVGNLSDGSSMLMLIATQRVHTELTLEVLAGVFMGRDGEFTGYARTMRPAAVHAAKDAAGLSRLSDETFLKMPADPSDASKGTVGDLFDRHVPEGRRPIGQIMLNLRLAM